MITFSHERAASVTLAALSSFREDADEMLALRYVSLRDTGAELRHTYYFTAALGDSVPVPSLCAEGDLRWFDLTMDPAELEMPPTARVALTHWLRSGRHDDDLRFVTLGAPLL